VAKMLGFIKISHASGTSVPLKAWLFEPLKALSISPVNSSLLFAILFNATMFLVAWFMWKRKWFVKV
jgi:predicted acyltransferase